MTAILMLDTNPKEIATLALAVQERQMSAEDIAKDVIKTINDLTRHVENPVLLL